MTTAGATGTPGIRLKREARCFKRTLVDLSGDLAHDGLVVVIQTQLLPRFLQRARFQVDHQRLSVALDDIRVEHPALIGNDSQKSVLEPSKIVRGKLAKLLADLLATPIDGTLENLFRMLLTNFLTQFVEDEIVEDGPVLEGRLKFVS